MPRHPYKKRQSITDPIYRSTEVAKLVNYVMLDGKKSVASNIVYSVLDEIKNKKMDPLQTLHQAIANVAPNFEVKPRRLGGASYLVPIEVRPTRKLFLALKWIVEAASTRSNKEYHSFDKKLTSELLDAAKNLGPAVAKKLQTEKLAQANKAFAHLIW